MNEETREVDSEVVKEKETEFDEAKDSKCDIEITEKSREENQTEYIEKPEESKKLNENVIFDDQASKKNESKIESNTEKFDQNEEPKTNETETPSFEKVEKSDSFPDEDKKMDKKANETHSTDEKSNPTNDCIMPDAEQSEKNSTTELIKEKPDSENIDLFHSNKKNENESTDSVSLTETQAPVSNLNEEITNIDNEAKISLAENETPVNISTSLNNNNNNETSEKVENAEWDQSSIETDHDLENSAVAAVLAAVEEATAAKASLAIGSDTNLNESSSKSSPVKVVKKKAAKNSSPTKTSLSNLANENGSSSGQKRRKKDPLAPKAPLNGYLVYFNEERAEMRQKNPSMGFGELTKIIALKWKELSQDEKQKYTNEAELDKERYVKEMADYKKSDSYKQYLKETAQAKLLKQDEAHMNNSFSSLQNENSSHANSNHQTPNINWLQTETNVAGFDIPIFTEEFIEHSKSREHEMRQLRREIAELEQQNSVLHKHIENMKQTTTKIETEIDFFNNNNNQIQKNLDIFRQTIIHCFNNLPLPNSQEYPSPSNVDDYIMRLYSVVANSSTSPMELNDADRSFTTHVKNVLSNINFNSLFETSSEKKNNII